MLEPEQEAWLFQEQDWKYWKYPVSDGRPAPSSVYTQVLSEYPLVRKWSQSKLYLDACNIRLFELLDLKRSLDKEPKLNAALRGI